MRIRFALLSHGVVKGIYWVQAVRPPDSACARRLDRLSPGRWKDLEKIYFELGLPLQPWTKDLEEILIQSHHVL